MMGKVRAIIRGIGGLALIAFVLVAAAIAYIPCTIYLRNVERGTTAWKQGEPEPYLWIFAVAMGAFAIVLFWANTRHIDFGILFG